MSLALSMIAKDEVDDVERIVNDYGKYFDKIYLTVNKGNGKLFKDLFLPKVIVTERKWNDNFAEQREFNRTQIDTDYAFWIDCDDKIDHPENIPLVIKMMQQRGIDLVQLKYEYARNPEGESIADHWRERFWRVKHDIKWVGAVHETLISPNANVVKIQDMVIIHDKKVDHLETIKRNKAILLADYKKTKDPRSAHYLGLTFMGEKDYQKAIAYFLEHIEKSGWVEESYRSWCKIAECEYLLNNYKQAIAATDAATKLLPAYPDAYFIKTTVYSEMGEFDKSIEWVKVALSKPEPDTNSITDPTLYKYRGLFMAALAYLQIGRVKEAYALYQEVIKQAPDYPIAKGLKNVFEEAYYDQEAIDRAKWLMYYARDNNGKPGKVLEALGKLSADPRLNADRVKFFPKKTWPKGSIAYYCGPSTESWGPDTMDKGMGGSEEAVVCLSRELAKLGHEVTVFNDREEEINDNGVTYKPWTLLNPYDEFDTFIVWRMPENANGAKARKVFCDLHDTIEPQRVYDCAKNIDKYFVKSKYHRSLYPDLPDDKFVVVGNGISKEQFND